VQFPEADGPEFTGRIDGGTTNFLSNAEMVFRAFGSAAEHGGEARARRKVMVLPQEDAHASGQTERAQRNLRIVRVNQHHESGGLAPGGHPTGQFPGDNTTEGIADENGRRGEADRIPEVEVTRGHHFDPDRLRQFRAGQKRGFDGIHRMSRRKIPGDVAGEDHTAIPGVEKEQG
jgi:hypothetical protein